MSWETLLGLKLVSAFHGFALLGCHGTHVVDCLLPGGVGLVVSDDTGMLFVESFAGSDVVDGVCVKVEVVFSGELLEGVVVEFRPVDTRLGDGGHEGR